MTDQTPDFDSMTPEELMAWMESLAKRQGADEGFTTAADMAVPEIDASSVQLDEPGYIPYGMDPEKWAAKQEEERRRKAERQAARPQPAAPAPAPVQAAPPPAPVAAPPAPAPQPVAAPAAAAQPDFDSMTPEQLMAWMESLAKRQGVDAEQLTTSADMAVPEIDAGSVQLDEPGYIPYGMDPEKWAVKQEEERRRKAERQAARPAPAAPPPVAAAPPPPPPSAQPQLDLFAADSTEDDSTRVAAAADNPLAWLESLAADGGGAGSALPALDLGDLAQPVVPDLSALNVGGGQDDPMAWLESLSQGQNAIPGLDTFALDNLAAPPPPPAAPPPPPAAAQPAAAQPAADNPLEWLESLARRQGADSEELTTQAALDVPVPDPSLVNRGPGYTDYTFEAADSGSDADALDFLSAVDSDAFDSDIFGETLPDEGDDTSDWLTALAAGQVPDVTPAPRTDVIQSALSQGADIPPDVMKVWMDQMLEQGASRSDVPDYVDEADDQIVPAQLPDWLIEQVGTPPEITPAASSLPSTSPLVNQIVEPPAVEMPDWLREDISADSDPGMEDIFAFEDEALPPAAAPIAPTAPPSVAKISTSELEVDTNDPWVEAFELERKLDDEEVPSWYAAKIAALENGEAEPGDAVALAPAQLPMESELSLAEAQALPNWLDVREVGVTLGAAPTVAAPPAAAAPEPEPITPSMPDWLRDQMPAAEAAPAFSADMFLSEAVEVVEAEAGELPDWLREAGLSTDDEIEIPAWLTETLETNETPAVASAPAPAVVAAPAPVPQPAASPAPVVPAAQINVPAMLTQARSTFQAGQLDEAVQAYEAVIRANASLDDVVADLSGYIKAEAHKGNPALYRVLGDGLMRQGRLQQALDTYRKALNLL